MTNPSSVRLLLAVTCLAVPACGGVALEPEQGSTIDSTIQEEPGGASPDGPGFVQVYGRAGACVSEDVARSELFVPASNGGLPGTVERFVGSWSGQARAPYGWNPDTWGIHAEFRGDGTYSARGFDGTYFGEPLDGPAFYYGSDLDCGLKRWRMLDAGEYGGTGEIDVTFDDGDGCYLPTWQGLIGGLRFDASGNRARFELWRSDGYGPVVYDLWRVCTRD